MRKLAPAGLKAILQGQTSAAEAAAKGSVCARGKAWTGIVALRGLLSQAHQDRDTARLRCVVRSFRLAWGEAAGLGYGTRSHRRVQAVAGMVGAAGCVRLSLGHGWSSAHHSRPTVLAHQ